MDELEPWQQEIIDNLGAVPHLSQEDLQTIIASHVFEVGTERQREVLLRAIRASAPNIVAARFLSLGFKIRDAQALMRAHDQETAAQGRELGETARALTDDLGLRGITEELTRLPDVGRLHAYAQAALLRAVTRFADEATEAADVAVLADAYLTLPSPAEDGLADD